MQIQVQRLREAFDLLKPAVNKKHPMPALKNVLLKDGQAMGTNLEVGVAVELPELEGECMLPFGPVADVLKLIPWNDTLTLEQIGEKVDLCWNGGKASYQVPKPADFPPLPSVDPMIERFVDGDVLVPALLTISEYCATEQARPVLNGVVMFPGENLDLWGADGFRMGHLELPIEFPADGIAQVVIPSSAIRVLSTLWKKAATANPTGSSLVGALISRRMMLVGLGGKTLQAKFGSVTFITTLIQGDPPNFRQLIPTESAARVRVFAPDLERAARQVQGVAHAGSGIVRLMWSEVALTLSASSDEKGEAEATIAVDTSQPGRVALNVSYLLGYLKGKEGMVTMAWQNVGSPVLFEHRALPQVLIMPMHVQWPGEPAPPRAEAEEAEETPPVDEEPGAEEEEGEGEE